MPRPALSLVLAPLEVPAPEPPELDAPEVPAAPLLVPLPFLPVVTSVLSV